MLASRKSRESREMAMGSFYSTRRQCRRRQGVVVGDAEDVPSSIIEVEVKVLGWSWYQFKWLFHVCPSPTFTTATNVPWSWYLVHGHPRDRDRRVTWRVSISCFPHSQLKTHTDASSSLYTLFRKISVEPENQPPPQRPAPPSKRKRSSGDNTRQR
jgi:hypothetical protein